MVKEYLDLEEINAREAKSRAVVLEILGDIPDADIAPPKNVLFVCKLNPVTEQDDLKIIFSRFGTVNSCDVIRDYKTGDSLQYAFVEFETEDACNEAYFRMQNVLIDDRRIHVDFCQSVSGFWKRFKDKGAFTRVRKGGHASSVKDDVPSKHVRAERRVPYDRRSPRRSERSRTTEFHRGERRRRSRSHEYYRSRRSDGSRERHSRRHHRRSPSPYYRSRSARSRS